MIIKGRVRSIWIAQKRDVSPLVENICERAENCRSKKDEYLYMDDDHSQDNKDDNDQSTASCASLLDIDLNYPPYSHDTREVAENRQIVQEKKRRRATTKDVAKIGLADLSKYFDLTITEASRRMNVGLTVLKRKCREFGIPRWPHRKIKSLDNLILELKEEKDRQDQVCASAAIAVLKRQRMLETEKENIEKKPSMDIKKETKRFRQDVFKRKHYARTRGKKVEGESKVTLNLSS
ncbi:hypothetical protein Sjap_017524 [Stephania japonica]|uniref:RWP-RK domain-containing protein n=1 Tax=Stephania japonica TaxID=461633 RepID=A0AAP0NK15_9MAGN